MKVRRIDFSPDEWLAGTASLDNAERGLYITACALIYSRGGPIHIDDLKARCIEHGNALNRQLRRLVALGKLLRNGQEITNKRCENELEIARKRSTKGRQMADERWKNNALTDETALLDSNGNHQPSTINHQLIEKNTQKAAPPSGAVSAKAEFADWWQSYPRKVGKDAAARKYLAARKSVSADALLTAARRYAEAVSSAGTEPRYVAHPATWLHEGRWQDEEPQPHLSPDCPTGPPPKPEEIWPDLTQELHH